MIPLSYLAPCLALLAPPLLPLGPQSQVALFQGSPGQSGDVAVVDVTGQVPTQVPPGLDGVTLLNIDFHGRTELQRFLSGRPRLEQRAPGLTWLVLPAGQGSLWRYSRPEQAGGTRYGLLWIDAAGSPRTVFELPGSGPTGNGDPLSPRIAVDPAGTGLLVSTTLAAGGDLYEIDMPSGAATLRTAATGPLDVGTAGLALAPSWGIAACADRVVRFDRAAAGEAQEVSFGAGGTPAWLSGEVALSPQGLFAVTTGGSSPTLADVWVFGPTAGMRLATETPSRVSSAGFQPEWSHGPYLAVSDDGTRAAWRATVNTAGEDKEEAYMAIVPPPATPPLTTSHVSSDNNYLDTLDEIGEFLFKPGSGTLQLAVGEGAFGGGIEGLDVYEASVPTQGTEQLVNVTLTNGILSPPYFAKSELDPENGFFALDDGSVALHDSDSGGGGQFVRSVPGQSGIQTVIPNVKSLDHLEAVGSTVFAVLQRDQGNDDREVWIVPPTGQGAPALVMSMPETQSVLHTAVRSDGYVGFVQSLTTKERLWLLDVQNLSLRKLRKFLYGPTLSFAPSGELCFSVGAAGTLAIQGALPVVGPPFRLKVPVAPGFLMP